MMLNFKKNKCSSATSTALGFKTEIKYISIKVYPHILCTISLMVEHTCILSLLKHEMIKIINCKVTFLHRQQKGGNVPNYDKKKIKSIL